MFCRVPVSVKEQRKVVATLQPDTSHEDSIIAANVYEVV